MIPSIAAQQHTVRPSPPRIFSRASAIVSDGIAMKRDRDAPGQECVYIPGGEYWREEYRIGTFAKYPPNSPVSPVNLAKMGFYYTGYRDRVKCFSCGMTAQEWMLGDDVTSHRWHKSQCLMIATNQGDPSNVRSDFLSLTLGNYLNLGRTTDSNRRMGDVVSGIRQVNIAPSRQHNRQREFTFASIHDAQHEQLLKSMDLSHEDNRRKTYQKWPSYPAPHLPPNLAENGLFYLGNLDRTQCIFCAGVLRNWAPGDNVAEQHAKHFPQCTFVLRGDTVGNVRMSDQDRQAADEIDNTRLRRQGVLGDQDTLTEPPNPTEEEQRRLAILYPLDNPMNPHMASYERRLETFSTRWPQHTRATVETIARAGFFFLGQSDKTKCFYCNGGLQNWDRNDEPWTEHAKWFYGCAFIIRQKGQDFVRNLHQLHPNLNRPNIRYPVSYNLNLDNVPPVTGPQESVSSTSLIEAATNMGFPLDLIQRVMHRLIKLLDALSEFVERHEQIIVLIFRRRQELAYNSGALLLTSLVSSIDTQLKISQIRSASHDKILTVFRSKMDRDSSGYGTISELLDDLLVATNDNQRHTASTNEAEEHQQTSDPNASQGQESAAGTKRNVEQGAAGSLTDVKKTRTQSTTDPSEMEATNEMRESLRAMQESSVCKSCQQNVIDVVCIPCGHLALCTNCSPRVQRCPLCNTKIQETMKIFRA